MRTKLKQVTACCVVALILLAFSQVLLPQTRADEQSTNEDRAYWLDLAEKAWRYYQPGNGVNSQTGLHGAGLGWPYFTEWDLGTYVQATIDARELGILQDDGQWGFNYRIDKVLNFLKTRELTSNNVPFLNYDSRNGAPYGETGSFSIDEGKLFIALYNLKTVRPDFAQDVDYIVKERSNVSDTIVYPLPSEWVSSRDLYCYYIAFAFKEFGFQGWSDLPSSIISHIDSQQQVFTNGVALPTAHICTEPLLHTMFDIDPQNQDFSWLASQVNLAQEARYNATGRYTAFSEGNTGLGDPSYVYEYVVDYDGSTWKVAPDITPIVYLKVAVGFDAIYNTEYTHAMVQYLLSRVPATGSGFREGVAEDGRVVDNVIDRTNGLILSAARYAIDHLPDPSASPTPSPTATPTSSSPSETPSSSGSPQTSPSPSATTGTSPSPSTSSTPADSSTPTASVTPSSTPAPSDGWSSVLTAIVVVSAACLIVVPTSILLLKRRNHQVSKSKPEGA